MKNDPRTFGSDGWTSQTAETQYVVKRFAFLFVKVLLRRFRDKKNNAGRQDRGGFDGGGKGGGKIVPIFVGDSFHQAAGGIAVSLEQK